MNAPWFSDGQVIGQLNSNSTWSGSTISYGFLQSVPWWDVNREGPGFSAFTAAQESAARSVIGLWDELIAPSMVEHSFDPINADINFANSYVGVNYAHAYLPGTYLNSGEIWLNAATYTYLYTPTSGDYAYLTLLHEVGHAIGLTHPGAYNGGFPTYATHAEYAQDTHQWSVMSYFDASYTGADWNGGYGWQYAQTPMVHDVLAIQAMYGADPTTRTGDTVYGFNSNAGNAVYNFSLNSSPVLTIYDAAGLDTLDLSGFTLRADIDLAPGSYSSAGGVTSTMTYNIGIAASAVIENAYGGSGVDVIRGNFANNHLKGNAGDDKLFGFAGDDVLEGGTGSDWVVYLSDIAAYTITVKDTFVEVVGEGIDQVFLDVENYYFGTAGYTLQHILDTYGTISIEENGDTKLIREYGVYKAEDSGGNAVTLSYAGTALGEGSNGQWTAVEVEDRTGGGYELLWRNAAGDYNLWQMDSAGNYLSDIIFAASAAADYETIFQADLNNDGRIGADWNTLETNGDIDLLEDTGSRYMMRNGSGDETGIYYLGAPLTPGAFGGWAAVQAEQVSGGGFEVLLHNAGTGQYAVWVLDSGGHYQDSFLLEPTQYPAYEDVFSFDLNNDGSLGSTSTVVETNGAHDLLWKPGTGYRIKDSGGAEVGIYYNGAPLEAGAFGGWSAVQAEAGTGSAFSVLLYNPQSDQYALWELDSQGHYVASRLIEEAEMPAFELLFQTDIDEDGSIGSGPVVLESDGDHTLINDGGLRYLIEDSASNQITITYNSEDFRPGDFGGWTALHADGDGSGGYNVLITHSASDLYAIWTIDGAGEYKDSWLVDPVTFIDLEQDFHVDLTGDGYIGRVETVLETNGSVSLVSENEARYIVRESGNPDLTITYNGEAFVPGAFGGWKAVQVEAASGGDGYDVLIHNANTSEFGLWVVDENGEYVDSWLIPNADLSTYESTFDFDIDGSGAVDAIPALAIEPPEAGPVETDTGSGPADDADFLV
ncbi:MAG: M10 family metallopeptidase C-terminal domain-containing protein [Pseudomonadota bacterium]